MSALVGGLHPEYEVFTEWLFICTHSLHTRYDMVH